jgi:hypothetical protein
MALNYQTAAADLERIFALAETDAATGKMPAVSAVAQQAAQEMFDSGTQSIREALLGCALARLQDQAIDITLPYINHGPTAFNGRTLDEQVVNPFLKAAQIPSSKGPYLASFRRSVKFDAETGKGVRDKKAFAAMLAYIEELKSATAVEEIEALVRHLLWQFVMLRDKSKITLARINRLSLPQLNGLIVAMLNAKSGGRFPVLLSTAMLQTLRKQFNLPWNISQQGINSADSASKTGGDIDVTDMETGKFVFSIEITERVIDRSRVISTFTSKISPHSIEDYLFFYSMSLPEKGALEVARQYFAQGHDISFLNVEEWLRNSLATVGSKGRTTFTNEFVDLLDQQEMPSEMKVLWNDLIKQLHEPPADTPS